jgi:hypothetical protein
MVRKGPKVVQGLENRRAEQVVMRWGAYSIIIFWLLMRRSDACCCPALFLRHSASMPRGVHERQSHVVPAVLQSEQALCSCCCCCGTYMFFAFSKPG